MTKHCEVVCNDWADIYHLTHHMTVDLGVEKCEVEYTERYTCHRGFNSDSQKIACFTGMTITDWRILCELTDEQIKTLKNEYEYVCWYNENTGEWEKA